MEIGKMLRILRSGGGWFLHGLFKANIAVIEPVILHIKLT